MVIFGQKYRVKKIKNLGEKSGLAGYFDPVKKEIGIDASLKSKDLDSTILHEFLHATFHRCGFNQTNIPHSLQELLVENFSIAIVENFRLIKK